MWSNFESLSDLFVRHSFFELQSENLIDVLNKSLWLQWPWNQDFELFGLVFGSISSYFLLIFFIPVQILTELAHQLWAFGNGTQPFDLWEENGTFEANPWVPGWWFSLNSVSIHEEMTLYLTVIGIWDQPSADWLLLLWRSSTFRLRPHLIIIANGLQL